MAGDWIPRQKGLNRKQEVLAIAKATGLHRRFVADVLMDFWEWCDAELIDGLARGLSLSELPGLIPDTDERFWQVVAEVGWLRVTSSGLSIPHFERWLGRSAKKRLQAKERQQISRDMSRSERDENVTTVLSSAQQEEKSPGVGGGAGAGGGKSAPSRSERDENVMSPAADLATEFAWTFRGTQKSERDVSRLTGLFDSLLTRHSFETIQTAIRAYQRKDASGRPERQQDQASWDFVKWLDNREGKTPPEKQKGGRNGQPEPTKRYVPERDSGKH